MVRTEKSDALHAASDSPARLKHRQWPHQPARPPLSRIGSICVAATASVR